MVISAPLFPSKPSEANQRGVWSSDLSIPVNADAHIKYQSKKRFGAVLVARNPITLTAYNDESLFKDWIEDNKARLYELFSHQLKKYGLWVITTTYTAPGCSINAWMDSKTDAVLSAKAQADMAGEFGAELDWTDKLTDKDWCHYTARPVCALRGSKETSSMQSSIHRKQPNSRNPGSDSRSPDAAASSVNSILVTPRQSSSPEAASSEGVVMFYNGHYADPLEWWVVGAKSVSTSIFGSKLGEAVEDDILEHHSHPRSGAAHCNTCIRVQSLAHKGNRSHSTNRRGAEPILSSDEDFEMDYDPEKDEGVYPRYWPSRDPGLRASRQAKKRLSSVGANLEHTDLVSRQRQSRGERHQRDGVQCRDMGKSAG